MLFFSSFQSAVFFVIFLLRRGDWY